MVLLRVDFVLALLSLAASPGAFELQKKYPVRIKDTVVLFGLSDCLFVSPSCSDEGLTLETSVQNHFHGVKLIYINLKLIHYMFVCLFVCLFWGVASCILGHAIYVINVDVC